MEEKTKKLISNSFITTKMLAKWARGVGLQNSEATLKGKAPPSNYWLANYLVLSKIKESLGLDKVKILYVSAAPMKQSTFEYFKSLDLPIINIYGMSECCGPETTARPGKFKENTAGYAYDETHIKIDQKYNTEGGERGEGEVCFRGRNNFNGYLNNVEKTLETLDSDGYIHSGDIGYKDNDGFVKITGRIKELIITAGGENVAPVPIEDSLK
jgi:long-chain-fatty-acid--CoA ligase ACSBG